MSDTFLVFTDEAGAYNKLPSEPFRRSHPFYIRSNVCLSAEDYRVFQGEIQSLNKRYGIPVGEEVKWSDLWETHRGKYRAEFLKGFSEDQLKSNLLAWVGSKQNWSGIIKIGHIDIPGAPDVEACLAWKDFHNSAEDANTG